MGRDTLMQEQIEMFEDVKSVDTLKGTMVCSQCKEEKSFKDFRVDRYNKNKQNTLRSTCIQCDARTNKTISELRKVTPPPPKDYKCPICLKNKDDLIEKQKLNPTSAAFNKPKDWILDHDHDTKKFRGWLCDRCNIGLGQIGDNINNLERALKYLKDFKNNS